MLETVVVVTLLNFLSTILYILSSFGDAIFFQLGWQICTACTSDVCSGEVYEAVLYISIALAISAPLQVYSMWKYINWPIAINLTLSQLIGGYLGILLLLFGTSVWMVRSLGIFFALVTVQYIFQESKGIAKKRKEEILAVDASLKQQESEYTTGEGPEGDSSNNRDLTLVSLDSIESPETSPSPSSPTSDIAHISDLTNPPTPTTTVSGPRITLRYLLFIWGVGLSAGLLGGLFATSGPILMIYVTRSSMTKDEVRGTIAVPNVFLTLLRVVMISLLPNSPFNIFTNFALFVIIGIVCSSITGRYVGDFFNKFVDDVLFRRLIMGILGFGSIPMMTSGVSLIFRVVACVVIMFLYVALAFITYHYYGRISSPQLSIHEPLPSRGKYVEIIAVPSPKSNNELEYHSPRI